MFEHSWLNFSRLRFAISLDQQAALLLKVHGIDITPSIHKLLAVCCKLHNTHGVMERMYSGTEIASSYLFPAPSSAASLDVIASSGALSPQVVNFRRYVVNRILHMTWRKNALESTAVASSYLSSEFSIRFLVSHCLRSIIMILHQIC